MYFENNFFPQETTQKHFGSPKAYFIVGVICLYRNYTAIYINFTYNVASVWSMDDQKGQNRNSRNQQQIQKEGVCLITSK